MIGNVVGNYRILSELGRGGMGMVYRAEHVQLGRPAALKMLLPQLSSDAAIVQRFFNEARAAAAIDHPGIVEIFDFGRHTDGSAYIVMPLLRGESLEQRMRRAPLTAVESATLIAQIASALAAAHQLGIVHRDLKPDNIFLVPNEMMPFGIQPKLLDFGIAKLAGDHGNEMRTQTGIMMGTPAYMSPEQCMGKSDLDHRTDLYSLGCILYQMLVGRPPFTAEQGGTGMIIAAHLRDEPADLRSLDPSLSPQLAGVVHRLLAKDPAARFQSSLELRDALVSAGADAPRTRPPQLSPHADTGHAATMVATAGTGAAPIRSPSTTRSGSAAQLVAAQPKPARGKGVLAAVALLGVGAAAGVAIVAVQGDAAPDAAAPPAARVERAGSSTAAPPGDGTPPPPSTPDAALAATPPTSGPPPPVALAEAPMPAPPSSATQVPTTPPGSASPTSPPHPNHQSRRPLPTAPAKPGTAVAPSFTLSSSRVAKGEPITLRFSKPVQSPPDRRAWITVVEPGSAPAAYGAWSFVDDGATTMTFRVPEKPGTYEVRLHANYPAKAHDLRRRVTLVVDQAMAAAAATATRDQRFFAPTIAKPGETVTLHFPKPMRAADRERFWVTVVAADAPDTSYGAWEYVTDGARTASLAMPADPGSYELRLHANYPTKTTNVVFRQDIAVEP